MAGREPQLHHHLGVVLVRLRHKVPEPDCGQCHEAKVPADGFLKGTVS
jgi:hypothetical protein